MSWKLVTNGFLLPVAVLGEHPLLGFDTRLGGKWLLQMFPAPSGGPKRGPTAEAWWHGLLCNGSHGPGFIFLNTAAQQERFFISNSQYPHSLLLLCFTHIRIRDLVYIFWDSKVATAMVHLSIESKRKMWLGTIWFVHPATYVYLRGRMYFLYPGEVVYGSR